MRATTAKNNASPLAARIGKRIFELRSAKGWTQRTAAEKCGLSAGFFCDIENGKRGLSAENLYRISKVFRVSMDAFFRGAER